MKLIKKAQIKIYIKNKKRPLIVLEIEAKVPELLEDLISDNLKTIYELLNSQEKVIRIHNIIFNKDEFRYLEIISY